MSVTHAHTDKMHTQIYIRTKHIHLSHSVQIHSQFLYDKTKIENSQTVETLLTVLRSTYSTKKKMSSE